MKKLGRRSRGGQPRTTVGRWLLALLLKDDQERIRLASQLNGGKKGWNKDEAAVMQAACDVAVQHYFGSEYDIRQITEEVAFLRRADLDSDKTPHGQLEMEAVIRHALGETAVDVSGINAQAAFEIQGAIIYLISLRLGWKEPQVVQLITEAEPIAF